MDTAVKGVFCVRYGQREWLVKAPWVDKASFKNWYRTPNSNSAANLLTSLLLPTPSPLATVRVASANEGVRELNEVVKPTEALREVLLPTSTVLTGTSSEVKSNPLIEAKLTLSTIPAEERRSVGEALLIFTKNGRKITPAIREVWGITGGERFTVLVSWVKAAEVLKAQLLVKGK